MELTYKLIDTGTGASTGMDPSVILRTEGLYGLILKREALADSPVFDNVSGFGGDGDSTAGESVGNGYCVTDGPFSDLNLTYYGPENSKHCLSRGFTDGNVKGRLAGDMVRPAVIEEVLRQPEYANFFMKLEKGPHNQIPNGIRGDFFKFTAPNDPLFYLHHRYATRSTSQ